MSFNQYKMCLYDFGDKNLVSKLCLYVLIGLSVIIWGKSAITECVKGYKYDIFIKNLSNLERKLDDVSKSEYKEMRCNATRVGVGIRKGYDFIDAVEAIVGSEVKE